MLVVVELMYWGIHGKVVVIVVVDYSGSGRFIVVAEGSRYIDY